VADGGRDFVIGVAWLAAGLVVTVGSYAAAAGGAGRYIVAYGAIVVGVVRIVRSLGGRRS
jgi:hypothetical protein